MKIRKSKAQSFLEYTVLLAVLVAAFLAMRVYFVRSVQEKYRQSADVFGEGEQYARGVTQVTETASSLDITDTSAGRDSCSNVRSQVAALEKNITDLMARATQFQTQATQMRQQAQASRNAGFGDAGAQESLLIKMAADFENQARAYREEAADKQDEIDQLKTEYADCF
jgi:DNA anti-recombination protein RmuC